MSRRTLGLRIGLRREVLILLPVALFLLVLLSTITLFSYRSAIELLTEERRLEAGRVAGRLAAVLAVDPLPSAEELRRRLPQAERMAVTDADGTPVVAFGELPGRDLLAPFSGQDPLAGATAGPGELLPDQVAGLAPFRREASQYFVRVDLPAAQLAAQQRGLRVLSWVVLPVNAGLLLLTLFYLRHLLAPYETLLERARQAQPDHDESEDEISFLVGTFERALGALRERARAGTEDDIAALERTLGPSLESGLLIADRQGNVLGLNPVGAALLGIPAPEPGTELDRVLAPHPELLEMLREALATGVSVHRRELDIRGAGGLRTLGLTVHPLKRDDGSIRGSLVLFADLTEARRRAEEERISSSLAQVGELAAGVAHELRNSLATLRGYLTLVERAPDEESITDYLAEIRRESDHLQRVLEDFLSFARPGTTRPELIDLEGVARRAAVDPALEGFEVRVERKGERPTALKGDPQLLERAVRNLLHNAVEAERKAGRNGPLAVRVRGSREEILLSIDDRGPGIPEDLRERLFQPFVTGRTGGVGLGLALARRIVDLHGGRLAFEDRPEGGTRALIHFPR